MTNVAVIGVQWGDEGKGKIIDALAAHAHYVARFQGGHNAGHTIKINNNEYILSLIPSGILHPQAIGVIGNGVVVHPGALVKELELLQKLGINVGAPRLIISRNASLILESHLALDAASEAMHKENAIGTTKRGIGPAYEDRAGRRALKFAHLHDEQSLPAKIKPILKRHNALLSSMDAKNLSMDDILNPLLAARKKLIPYLRDAYAPPIRHILEEASCAKKKVIFEGAQGAMLDIDHGTYPHVTSSHTHASYAPLGLGISPHLVHHVMGVSKVYTTRVGHGIFPTEMDDSDAQYFRKTGDEFGAVTGRARRCGWLDAVLLKDALTRSGAHSLALTKLDVLDQCPQIKIATAYDYKGTRFNHLPMNIDADALTPIYESMEGWQSSTKGITTEDALPPKARAFTQRIATLCALPLAMISTGADRTALVRCKDPFNFT